MMKKANSAYIKNDSSLKLSFFSKRTAASSLITALVFVFVAAISVLPALTVVQPYSKTAVAAQDNDPGWLGIFCGDMQTLGSGMKKSDWKSFIRYYPSPEATGRTWTLQEAVGSGAKFTGYAGEKGKENFLVYGVGDKRGEGIGKFSEKLDRLASPRTATNCVFNTGTIYLGDALLKIGAGINALSQMVSVIAFDSKLICSDPANPSGHCFNLVKAIGGTTAKEGGIIGALTNNIYVPLSVLAAMLAGIYVVWTGLIQRKIRESIFAISWIILSFLVGVAILANPHILAKAPMAVTNTLTTCIVGAFNGNGCFDEAGGPGLNQDEQFSSNKICVSEANVPLDEQMSLTVNSLTCSVWRAFVLEPYTQGQFGRSFAEMDVTNSDVSKVISDAGLQGSDFCVNLGTTGSVDQQGIYVNLNQTTNQVCNVAAYQMYLGTKAQGAPGSVDKDTTPLMDENWYKVALVAASDDSMWDTWALSFSSGFKKISVGMVAILASLMGGFVIFVIAVMAMVYLLTSIIMIAFAPLFALLGVHPGRGRKLLIGWLEIIISNILKYATAAVFLVVTLALYGAVLGEMENLGLTLIFLFILSAALLMYRKEITELVGRVNMGGERLSNSFGEAVSKRVDRAKETGRAAVGGAIGAAGAAGTSTPMDYFKNAQDQVRKDNDLGRSGLHKTANVFGSIAKTQAKDAFKVTGAAASGARSSVKRDLRRGQGILPHAAREADRMQMDNKRDAKTIADTNREEANRYAEDLTERDSRVRETREDVDKTEAIIISDRSNYENAASTKAASEQIEAKLILDMKSAEPMFAQMKEIAASLNNVNRNLANATARGDTDVVAQLTAERDAMTKKWDSYRAHYDDDDFNDLNNDYERNLQDLHTAAGFEGNVDDIRSELDNTIIGYENKLEDYKKSLATHNDAVIDRNAVQQELNTAAATAKVFGDKHVALRPGEGFKDKDLKKLEDLRDKKADELDGTSMIDTYQGIEAEKFDPSQLSLVDLDNKPEGEEQKSDGLPAIGGTNTAGGTDGTDDNDPTGDPIDPSTVGNAGNEPFGKNEPSGDDDPFRNRQGGKKDSSNDPTGDNTSGGNTNSGNNSDPTSGGNPQGWGDTDGSTSTGGEEIVGDIIDPASAVIAGEVVDKKDNNGNNGNAKGGNKKGNNRNNNRGGGNSQPPPVGTNGELDPRPENPPRNNRGNSGRDMLQGADDAALGKLKDSIVSRLENDPNSEKLKKALEDVANEIDSRATGEQ